MPYQNDMVFCMHYLILFDNIKGDHMIKRIYHFCVDKKIPTLACSLAFNVIMSGGAFLFLFIILSGFFSNSFHELIINGFEDGKLKDLIIYFFNYQNNISYSIFLVITSIYSASSLYYHLISIVELITQVHYDISISKRIISVIITVIYLILFNFITLIATEVIINLQFSYQLIFFIFLMFVIAINIYIVNMISLRDYHFKRIIKGTIFTFIYMLLFTIGFIIYLKLFSDFKIIYGILSFFIIFFFYLYMISIGILLGIYFNFKNINIKELLKNK